MAGLQIPLARAGVLCDLAGALAGLLRLYLVLEQASRRFGSRVDVLPDGLLALRPGAS